MDRNVARLWHRLRYCLEDARDEWRHSPGVNLLALGTLAAALFLAGLVLLGLTNLGAQVERLRDDLRLQVFLRDDIAAVERAALHRELAELPGVDRVEHVTKDQALARYRAWAAEMAALAGELEHNPLPASLEVFLAAGTGVEETSATIAQRLAGRSGVEEVRFDRGALRRLEALLRVGRLGGGGIGLAVLGAVVAIMAGVMRLAVYARREEIEIMQLVGASPALIRGPFLVAGVAHGLVGALVALVAVEAVRRLALGRVGPGGRPFAELLAAWPLTAGSSALLLAIGVGVGLAGSWFAVQLRGADLDGAS